MIDSIAQLFGSRKALITMLAIVGIVVLAGLGRVAGEQALDFIKWIVTAWLAAQAYEDGRVKSAALLMNQPKPTANDP
ncbi:MAG TPA: hypothetical protein PKI27_00775 [Dermatophilaceae bacterium]|mgnify:CR=1 FL=1|jgi:hypothetical protein|nr:hypothetical protein [Dermatophilaceae bacterium]